MSRSSSGPRAAPARLPHAQRPLGATENTGLVGFLSAPGRPALVTIPRNSSDLNNDSTPSYRRRADRGAPSALAAGRVYTCDMELLGLAATGLAMVVVVFGVGVGIEILVKRRFGISSTQRADAKSEAHQQSVRSQLGGFGPSGSAQN